MGAAGEGLALDCEDERVGAWAVTGPANAGLVIRMVIVVTIATHATAMPIAMVPGQCPVQWNKCGICAWK